MTCAFDHCALVLTVQLVVMPMSCQSLGSHGPAQQHLQVTVPIYVADSYARDEATMRQTRCC